MDEDQRDQLHPVPGSSSWSGEGKLSVKLKIPKSDEDDRSGVGLEAKKNDEPRVCTVCNKGFGSGKALGGHMRIHVQAHKDSVPKKIKTNHHNATGSRFTIVENPTVMPTPKCSLCGKTFPSMKSLFGHMRCHPEREWRGIQPPPSASAPARVPKNNSSSSSVSDPEPNPIGCDNGGGVAIRVLPGWSVTGRRGRKSVTDEELLRAAVDDLMRLASGGSSESGLTYKQIAEEYEATNSNSLTNRAEIEERNWVSESRKRRIEESPVGFSRDYYYSAKKAKIHETGSTTNLDKAKGKAVLGSEEDGFDDELGSDKSGATVPSTEELIKNYKCETKPVMMKSTRNKRKKLKLKDLELVPAVEISPPQDRYKCSTCNKCFSSHQALGGHRSYHNKTKNNLTIDESIKEESQAIVISGVDDEAKIYQGSDNSKVVEDVHKCMICNKIFPTGQALGGHKRCHWTGPAEALSSSPPREASQKILGFDLNEVPPMEDEEGVESYQVGGHGVCI